MSTNSNHQPDQLEDDHFRETKLQRFLRNIDDPTLSQIEKYLARKDLHTNHECPSKNQKIRLWHDLCIIRKFKLHEPQINAKTNKKIIQELCRSLKNQISFSAATIRERIQKKLSNVTKQSICDHIKSGRDFTFDTKRKLLPMTGQFTPNRNVEKKELSLEDTPPILKEPKQWKKIQIIHCSVSESSNEVEEVVPPTRSNQRPIIKKMIREDEQENDIYGNHCNDLQKEYNTFSSLPDCESDDNYIFMVDKDKVTITSNQINTLQKKVHKTVREICLKNKHQQTGSEGEPHKNPINNIYTSSIKKNSRETPNNQQQIKEKEQQPTEEELKQFNSKQEWYLETKNHKKYGHLRWYPEEDEYLRNIISNPDMETAVVELHILMKFKTVPNIIARLEVLGLEKPDHILTRLAFKT